MTTAQEAVANDIISFCQTVSSLFYYLCRSAFNLT